MGIEEQFGEIVIAPRVLEKIIAIATAKVEGVHSFSNKSVSDDSRTIIWNAYRSRQGCAISPSPLQISDQVL